MFHFQAWNKVMSTSDVIFILNVDAAYLILCTKSNKKSIQFNECFISYNNEFRANNNLMLPCRGSSYTSFHFHRDRDHFCQS